MYVSMESDLFRFCSVQILQRVSEYIDIVERSPGTDGIHGLTLSNAMHLSTWTDDWVDLPFDEALFKKLLDERIASSIDKQVESKTLDASGTW